MFGVLGSHGELSGNCRGNFYVRVWGLGNMENRMENMEHEMKAGLTGDFSRIAGLGA